MPKDKAQENEKVVKTGEGEPELGRVEFEADLGQELPREKDCRMRLAAEYDNFRKRSAKEREAIFGEAMAAAVAEFLPLIDNLDRARAAAEAENATVEGLREGLDLIEKQFGDIREKLRLDVIDPAGQEFDPELHDAVMHGEDEAFAANTVSEVMQKGYKIGDRVIRHAMVKVVN